MNFGYPYLDDQAFLLEIDKARVKEEFVKLIVLTKDEEPLQEIQGKATIGSLSIDGRSAVRRTGSLTVIANEYENDLTDLDNLFAINKKCALEVGYTNIWDKYQEYPIIWLPQGIFLFDNPSLTHSTTDLSISLNLKDKMCQLDGTAGGVFPASTQLDKIDDFVDGKWTITRPNIRQIIEEIVNHMGDIPLSKIIISDVPDTVKVLKIWTDADNWLISEYEGEFDEDEGSWENRGLKSQIVNIDKVTNLVDSITGAEGFSYTPLDGSTIINAILNAQYGSYIYDTFLNGWDLNIDLTDPLITENDKKRAKIVKLITINDGKFNLTEDGPIYRIFAAGCPIGFTYEDFTYPSSKGLTANPGDTVTSILDKIINEVLGNFEYYFDVQGNFIFQEKKNFLNISQASIMRKAMRADSDGEAEKLTNPTLDYSQYYNFNSDPYLLNSKELLVSIANTPQYSEVKNDYIVWGARQLADKTKVPIRFHLAIDEKPTCRMHDEKVYWYYQFLTQAAAQDTEETGLASGVGDGVNRIALVNPILKDSNKAILLSASPIVIDVQDWRTELYLEGIESEELAIFSNLYFIELVNEWGKIYELVPATETIIEDGQEKVIERTVTIDGQVIPVYTDRMKPELVNQPYYMDYFLDFIDTDSGLNKISVKNIGKRSLIQDKSSEVSCMFTPDIPYINWFDFDQIHDWGWEIPSEFLQSYKWAAVPYNLPYKKTYSRTDSSVDLSTIEEGYTGAVSFAVMGSNYSCFEAVRNELYQHTTYNETVALTTLPIMHIEPNTRISLVDEETGISGEYFISSLSTGFEPTSTMTISATKIQQKI